MSGFGFRHSFAIGCFVIRHVSQCGSFPMRSTPRGEHRPVLLAEVLAALDPRPGQVVVDCTIGFGGHAAELLRRVGPTGKLDRPRPRRRQSAAAPATGSKPSATRSHCTTPTSPACRQVLAAEGLTAVERVLADLGVSSMQIDDAGRGFSFVRDGPLDMRMDRTRGKTAAQLLSDACRPTNWRRASASSATSREARSHRRSDRRGAASTRWRRTRELADLIERGGPGADRAAAARACRRRGSSSSAPPPACSRRCASWSTASWRT